MRDRERLVEIGDHHRQWLGVAVLTLAQLSHRSIVRRVAGEMITADPLDGDDAAIPDFPGGDCDRVDVRHVGPAKSHTRPTLGAGNALGVAPAVAWVRV